MTGSLMTTAAEGAAAGLGVAMPVGAIGVLLLQEGGRGWRPAAGGALAVAAVDMLYAAVAVLVGPQVARLLAGTGGWVRLVSAALLGVIAIRGLLSLRGAGALPTGEQPAAGGSAARSFLRFGLLTLVNPATALYFTALTAARGDSLHGGAGGAVFVAGVFVASLLWQQLVAAAGAFGVARLGARARRASYALGYGVVAVLAVRLAWPV
ncbi:LysE family transporter [Kitasatospora sp. NPDC094015]|uniref:LysE family transporter n=1 Tax=Kitasatospora sp. NPDC094015 TaxID=3155205 RepID=UPI003333F5F2